MIYVDYSQQNIFKKHVKLIFLYAIKIARSKGYAFLNVPSHVYSEI